MRSILISSNEKEIAEEKKNVFDTFYRCIFED